MSVRNMAAFLGGMALALGLSPWMLSWIVGEGIVVGFAVRRRDIFLVVAAMTVVLDLILSLGFRFRGWRALSRGVLAGIVVSLLPLVA